MKKLTSLLLALLLCTAFACAETEPAAVYVSISDETGALVLTHAPVAVTDLDQDGALTIADALACAHAEHHEQGADAFGLAETEYGLSMTCLWGAEQGSSFGYYLNDASAWSLLDPVKENDHVKAFVYTDLTTWSDTYCFFDAVTLEAFTGADVALTLSAAALDENWAPVTVPLSLAHITVNGEDTSLVTDETGLCTLSFANEGVYVISAYSDTQTLVAPVCIITVTAAQ